MENLIIKNTENKKKLIVNKKSRKAFLLNKEKFDLLTKSDFFKMYKKSTWKPYFDGDSGEFVSESGEKQTKEIVRLAKEIGLNLHPTHLANQQNVLRHFADEEYYSLAGYEGEDIEELFLMPYFILEKVGVMRNKNGWLTIKNLQGQTREVHFFSNYNAEADKKFSVNLKEIIGNR